MRTPWRALAVLIALTGAVAIATTYRTFSQTFDEPAHIASGMEWLDLGGYHYEAQHPPLARIAAAAGPYLIGARSTHNADQFREGNAILGADEHYRHTLAVARLGELPFFLALCLYFQLQHFIFNLQPFFLYKGLHILIFCLRHCSGIFLSHQI